MHVYKHNHIIIVIAAERICLLILSNAYSVILKQVLSSSYATVLSLTILYPSSFIVVSFWSPTAVSSSTLQMVASAVVSLRIHVIVYSSLPCNPTTFFSHASLYSFWSILVVSDSHVIAGSTHWVQNLFIKLIIKKITILF